MIIFIERLLLLAVGPLTAYLIGNGTIRIECQQDVAAAFNFTGSIFLTALSIIVASRYKGIPGQTGLIQQLKNLLIKTPAYPVIDTSKSLSNATTPETSTTTQTQP